MKKTIALFSSSLILFASCSYKGIQNTPSTDEGLSQDKYTGLYGKVYINPVQQLSDSIGMKFTVINSSKKPFKFCKWNTPFEPPISKYLDIQDAYGNEVPYRGAMAKRVMPPPPSSYITLQSGDSLSTTVNLLKSYAMDKPGKYALRYNAKDISGITVKDSLSFEIK